jgi:hypothetical protein
MGSDCILPSKIIQDIQSGFHKSDKTMSLFASLGITLRQPRTENAEGVRELSDHGGVLG